MVRLPPILKGTEEAVLNSHANGAKFNTHHFKGGKLVARCSWEANGGLGLVVPVRGGRENGVASRYHENGRLMWRTTYRNGLEHGLASQWNSRGKLLGKYRMVHGTGVDLWWDEQGRLLEERNVRDGKMHGVERWWMGPLWRESYWWEGAEHGIHREWRVDGRLKPGFPKFYLRGEKVTKAVYARAALSDKTLPEYTAKGDTARRAQPQRG
jgi:antitoxin component YwqK of YwqJK toxin-antitoxin module